MSDPFGTVDYPEHVRKAMASAPLIPVPEPSAPTPTDPTCHRFHMNGWLEDGLVYEPEPGRTRRYGHNGDHIWEDCPPAAVVGEREARPNEALIERLNKEADHWVGFFTGTGMGLLLREAADALRSAPTEQSVISALNQRGYSVVRSAGRSVPDEDALTAILELIDPEQGMASVPYGDGRRYFVESDIRAALAASGRSAVPEPAPTTDALLAAVEQLRTALAPLEYGMDGLIDLVKHLIRQQAQRPVPDTRTDTEEAHDG